MPMHTGYSVFNQPFLGQPAKTDLAINAEQYQAWKHQSVWGMLQDHAIGQNFCEYFGITDLALFYQKDTELALKHIQDYYVA
jgi:hypothetical protein